MHKLREKLLPYQNVIWDWNGTLLEDLDITHQVLCTQLKEYGLPEITRAEYLERFRFPIKDYYGELGFDIGPESFDKINRDFMIYYEALAPQANLFRGTHDFLSDLSGLGKEMYILSLAQHSHLLEIVKKHQIFDFFKDVRGHDDFCGRSKVRLGQRLVAEHNIDPKTTILIGDTDHDYEVAQALGVDVLVIADGHQSYERLERRLASHPHPVVFKTRYIS